jgi:hypothetical protein
MSRMAAAAMMTAVAVGLVLVLVMMIVVAAVTVTAVGRIAAVGIDARHGTESQHRATENANKGCLHGVRKSNSGNGFKTYSTATPRAAVNLIAQFALFSRIP